MNNTRIINTFNTDNSNIANIKNNIITKRFLKFKLTIKIPIVANYTFFTVINYSNINSFA